MNPLNQTKAAHYLAAQYPELKEEIETLSHQQNFAGVVQALINYARLLLAHSQIKTISRQIKFVGRIYVKGDAYIQDILENLFVRSFKGLKKRCTPQQWQSIFIKLPQPFKKIYTSQKNDLIDLRQGTTNRTSLYRHR